jgi:hypothetical protein
MVKISRPRREGIMGFWIGSHSPSRFLNRSGSRTFRRAVGLLALFVSSFFLGLSIIVVPAPTAGTATEVSGTLLSVSSPNPEYGDMGIVLDDGQSYYVNRATEVGYFAWEQMLSEVHPGDTLHLTAVAPLPWRWMGARHSQPLPVAGVRTASTVYMNPAISADTWTAQARFEAVAGLSLLLFGLCLLPEIVRRFRPRPPTNTVAV